MGRKKTALRGRRGGTAAVSGRDGEPGFAREWGNWPTGKARGMRG